MPQVYEKEIVYDYPAAHTLLWLMRKYPNPQSPQVFSVDTISRTMDPDTGVVRSERILGIKQGAPKWITKLFSLPQTTYVREVIFIDPAKDQATMMSMNLDLAQYINVLEYITYTPFPREQGGTAPSTLFRQHALMHSAFPTRMIARRIEKASVDRFKSNAETGKMGFDWVLRKGLEFSGNMNGNGNGNGASLA
ncbi:uncharacterized protein CcaverHIS019_0500620 [Cutaneotrichosporon cavernicola]|uniref:PRELI/MSF1 domain-containing protein n=1 Tax=Cutaneotrichosporon cavernicola TaxID=279322 RepID=A0AA48L5M8_9TREE|nr:uncharacterized protein CcaverHIS019_0500620 [Cutaneotrichosporon cavernicola]BEI92434.1 hypothetical protein CcaverHIS019_0500620 [Cutaneotrichosporon cavernicola]BEJ00207.1 hypothetical protein CcaverHIS631_0500640 [Cutaneotrichosporon cavernicola]